MNKSIPSQIPIKIIFNGQMKPRFVSTMLDLVFLINFNFSSSFGGL